MLLLDNLLLAVDAAKFDDTRIYLQYKPVADQGPASAADSQTLLKLEIFKSTAA